jgi:hypothetical protein
VPLVDGLEDFINRNDPRVKANQLPNISRYRLLGNADFENMTQVEWRIKKIFPLQGMAAIYGPSGAGKTFLANDAACAIAEGRNWFGYRVKAAPVLYVVLEGEAVFQNRIQAWKRHNDRPLPGNLRVIMQPFCLTNPANLNDLAAIAPKGCVMFIDTMNRSVPTADENSSKDMGEIIKGAKDLERLTNGLIVLIAHPGKDPTKGLRGHSSLIAALDSVICVTRENDLRRWIVEKSKDDIDGSKHTFQLQTINLGIDEDGEVITSCVIVPSSYVESPDRDKPLTPNKQLGWNSFIEASKDNECFDKSGNFKGVHLDKWRNEFYRVCPADNQDAKKKAFQRARKDLLELKRLTVSNDVYRFDSLYAINEGWIKKSLKTQAGH